MDVKGRKHERRETEKPTGVRSKSASDDSTTSEIKDVQRPHLKVRTRRRFGASVWPDARAAIDPVRVFERILRNRSFGLAGKAGFLITC